MKHATFPLCQPGVPTPPHIKAAIVRMYKAGVLRRDIMAKFGCGKNTLSKILKEYGVEIRGHSLTPVPEERVEAIRKLWEQGKTLPQVAAELGITKNAVAGIVHRKKLSRDPAINAANSLRARRENGHKMFANLAKGRVEGTKRPRKPRDPSAYKVSSKGRVFTMPPTVDLPLFTGATPTSVPKHWLQRLSGECTWPVSGEGADTFSCCAPVVPGKNWCVGHCRTGLHGWRSTKGGYHAEPKSFAEEIIRRWAA